MEHKYFPENFWSEYTELYLNTPEPPEEKINKMIKNFDKGYTNLQIEENPSYSFFNFNINRTNHGLNLNQNMDVIQEVIHISDDSDKEVINMIPEVIHISDESDSEISYISGPTEVLSSGYAGSGRLTDNDIEIVEPEQNLSHNDNAVPEPQRKRRRSELPQLPEQSRPIFSFHL